MSRSAKPPPRAPEPAPAPVEAAPHVADATLHRLEWSVLRRLDGLLLGEHRTLFRGNGMDLADLREYQTHDDVRHIDWNVTARLQQPHVREFHEDRELTAWFLVDLSPSIDFGSGRVHKRTLANDFVAVLARLFSRRGNRVGAMLYGGPDDSSAKAFVPARTGRQHVLHILHRMQGWGGPAKPASTDLGRFLRDAVGVLPRRSLVFVVSDFISEPGWGEALGRLSQRHEVVAVRLYDPLEFSLPDLGLVVMQDAETGEQLLVDTHDRGFRKRFQAAAAKREAMLQEAFAHAGIDVLELATDDDLFDSVLRFVELRRQRARLPAPARLQNLATPVRRAQA